MWLLWPAAIQRPGHPLEIKPKELNSQEESALESKSQTAQKNCKGKFWEDQSRLGFPSRLWADLKTTTTENGPFGKSWSSISKNLGRTHMHSLIERTPKWDSLCNVGMRPSKGFKCAMCVCARIVSQRSATKITPAVLSPVDGWFAQVTRKTNVPFHSMIL